MRLQKPIAVLLFFCFIHSGLSAQTVAGTAISGRVIQQQDQSPVAYATIRISVLNTPKERVIIAGQDGSFSTDRLKPGQYQMVTSAVGFSPRRDTVSITGTNDSLHFGDIILTKKLAESAGVTVVGKKPLVTREIDRLLYDVQSDPESSFQSAAELLRKVPMVTIGGDGRIRVRGLDGFRIYVDGRPSVLFSSNPLDVLRNMPAANIARIEVITTPPSNFDAEGFGGIINIVLVRKTGELYNGRIGSRFSTPAGGGALNGSFTYSKKKFAFSLSGSISKSETPNTTFEMTRTSGKGELQVQQSELNSSELLFYTGQAQVSYEADTLNLITLSFNANVFDGGSKRGQQTTIYDDIPALSQSFRLDGSNDFSQANYSGGFNLQHRARQNKNRLVTFSYNFSAYDDTYLTRYHLGNVTNYPYIIDYTESNDRTRTEHTVQTDFVIPGKNVNIETGVKAILRNNTSDYFYLRDTTGKPMARQDNDFGYRQNVYGVYASAAFKIKKMRVKTGLRLEQTSINSPKLNSIPGFDRNNTHIVPSLSLQHKLTAKSNLTFGHSHRLWRPNILQLDPFVNIRNPQSISTGNPLLKTARSHNTEVFYNYQGKASIDVGVNYFSSRNNIEIMTFFDTLTSITYGTYRNASNKSNIGISLSVNYPITKNLSFSSNANCTWFTIKGTVNDIAFVQHGKMLNGFASLTRRFRNNLNLVVSGNYNNGILLLQGQTGSFGTYSVSLSKAFFNRKLNTSVYCNNPFDKFRYMRDRYVYNSTTQVGVTQSYYRQFGLSVNYRFGKLQSSVKQNIRRINNDDVRN